MKRKHNKYIDIYPYADDDDVIIGRLTRLQWLILNACIMRMHGRYARLQHRRGEHGQPQSCLITNDVSWSLAQWRAMKASQRLRGG